MRRPVSWNFSGTNLTTSTSKQHKVAFADRLWETDAEDYEEMTIEEFLEAFVDAREQRDPLFVTKRFLMFQESLTKALTEEAEGDQSEDY